MANYFMAPAVNYLTKTLSGGISDVASTITLNNTTNMLAPGYIVVNRTNSSGTATPDNREVIYFTGISGSDLTGCTRAADGSTARTHADASLVETTMTAGAWNSLTTIVSSAIDSNSYLKAIASPVSIARMQIVQEAVTSIASIARAEIAFSETKQTAITSIASIAVTVTPALYTSNVSAVGRVNVAQLALSSIASTATAEFDIRNQNGHLDIRAGVSKLVKTPSLRQDKTVAAYQDGSIVQHGWGFLVASSVQENVGTVTFPLPFSTVPVVYCMGAGVAGATPATVADFASGPDNENLTWTMNPRNVTVTGFNPGFYSSGAFGAAKYLGYTWMAIGTL